MEINSTSVNETMQRYVIHFIESENMFVNGFQELLPNDLLNMYVGSEISLEPLRNEYYATESIPSVPSIQAAPIDEIVELKEKIKRLEELNQQLVSENQQLKNSLQRATNSKSKYLMTQKMQFKIKMYTNLTIFLLFRTCM